MAVVIDPEKYGSLLSRTLPRVIESGEDLARLSSILEDLDFADREISAEERELAQLIEKLIAEYDRRIDPFPPRAPAAALSELLDLRGLRPKDLEPLLGASSTVSDVLSGKRGISKSQVVRLAKFFNVPAELFLDMEDAKTKVSVDDIRAYVSQKYLAPARRAGRREVVVMARDVHQALGLINCYPMVCNALRGVEFLRRERVTASIEGPPSGQSSTVKVTYRFA